MPARCCLLMIVLLAGCADPPIPKPRRDGTCRVAMTTDIASLDPAINYEVQGSTFVRLLYETLLDYGEGTDLVPLLAESLPTLSPDGKTYEFTIRKGIRFESGRELTAGDFVYSLERLLDPRTRSPGDGLYRIIAGAEAFQEARVKEAEEAKADAEKEARRQRGERWIEPTRVAGLEATGPHSLRITLERPDPTFLYVLTMPFSAPVPRESVERWGDEFHWNPDGTGPFRLAEWTRGSRIRFERRPDHRDFDPKRIKAVEVVIGVDYLTQQMMFESGDLDYQYAVSPASFRRVMRDPYWSKTVWQLPANDVFYIALNTEMPPLDNRKVRQAINHAIDRDRILSLIGGRGVKANGVLPPEMPGHDPARQGYAHDPEKARKLLREAGYPNGFRLPLWVPSDSETRVKVAQSVKQDLDRIGIDVDIKTAAYVVFDAATGKRRNTHACIFGWVQDYPDPSNFLDVLLNGDRISDEHSNNLAFYSNPKVNALLREAALEYADPRRRLGLYQQAESLILDDAPWVCLYHTVEYRQVQPWVKGFAMHPIWAVRFDDLWFEEP